MAKTQVPVGTLRARFFSGDVVLREIDLYRLEAEYFLVDTLKEFNESLEQKRLEKVYGCSVSVRIEPVP